MIPRLHVPVVEPEDVVRHLGKQEVHWKEGRSAHALATAWVAANAFPPRVSAVLGSHPDFVLAELIDAFVERQVELGSEGRPSQTDLLAVAGIGDRLAILAVEGKAGESFGDIVGQWLDESAGKRTRLDGLCRMLGLSREEASPLRYQLLHRSASAIIEARRYRANAAALLVHSFSDDERGFADFAAFAAAVGFAGARPDTLLGPVDLDGIKLYAGWVQDRPVVASTYLDSLRGYAQRLEQWCERVRGWCDEQSSKLKPAAE
ncbi:DUF6946 family protein [Methyloceanibacter sp.]|uniref:DUF6946 family protein n=1 Tax=Methyloceanibacter sp. TaxID=1965321 RepID=UPI0039C92288